MISARPHLFTSESVTEGHPDKMADQISDAILDTFLEQDEKAHVAVECVLKTGLCQIVGEVRSQVQVNFSQIARKKIMDIGYVASDHGFDGHTCSVLVGVEEQSKDIALGVDATSEKEQGAGDQGLMFGYACDETPELMPLPITYAHALAKRLAGVRKSSILPFLGPDGKTQVTILYENTRPVGIKDVVVSSQHLAGISQSVIREAIIEEVVKKTVKKEHLLPDVRFHINPTGAFVIGGPVGDAGLTGRKIIVDTYGGMGRHGGGAFSGKDPSKVDRSAAYMARYLAKNVVAAGLAKRCEVQLAYAIGVSEPISLMVNSFNTSVAPEDRIESAIKRIAPLKPAALIKHLKLLRPIYSKTAAYGHFGRQEPEFTWEHTDLVDELKHHVL
ncbi:MAG TPA: methionine adenosyltransferase [Myxococcota bacterium]|nr:methionine adenosyltransferase [Myxococcota bacterium]